jgi:hypothetical protein
LTVQYLAELWGDNEAFADGQELHEFLGLLMRHWNSIGRKLEEDDVFTPLLFEDEEGTVYGNDRALGLDEADQAASMKKAEELAPKYRTEV